MYVLKLLLLTLAPYTSFLPTPDKTFLVSFTSRTPSTFLSTLYHHISSFLKYNPMHATIWIWSQKTFKHGDTSFFFFPLTFSYLNLLPFYVCMFETAFQTPPVWIAFSASEVQYKTTVETYLTVSQGCLAKLQLYWHR